MKIAVISDIHSNVFALEAVLSHIETFSVDQIVNLGDALWGFVDPVATAHCLMSKKEIIHIMGNCDEMLLQENNPSPSYQFTSPLLNNEILKWLANFRKDYRFENILFVHGCPDSKYAYLTRTITEKGMVQKPLDQIDDTLKDIEADSILCGHDHQRQTTITPKGKLIINPGSVGLPAYMDDHPFPYKVENHSPYARYAILTVENKKITSISHQEVLYDWKTASQMARANGSQEYALSILTGRI